MFARTMGNAGNTKATTRQNSEKTFYHSECGSELPVPGAVLEDGTTWCSGCNTIFTASSDTLTVRYD